MLGEIDFYGLSKWQTRDALKAQGLLALSAGKNVVRFLPPLTLGEDDLEDAVDMISDALDCTFGE